MCLGSGYFEKRQDVAVGCRHFHSWKHRQLGAFRSGSDGIHRLGAVVICDGNDVETLCEGRGDNLLWRRGLVDVIVGGRRMKMEVAGIETRALLSLCH